MCRDLDDEGRLLWIPFGKTKRSKRALEVPELLRPYLLKLARGRKPEEQLFGTGAGLLPRERDPEVKRPRDREWVLRQVQALCKQADVPIVCAHSLRGLHATLATEAGATPHLVATALGHSSIAVAERHYTDRGAAHRAKTRKVIGRLGARASRAERRSSLLESARDQGLAALLTRALGPSQRARESARRATSEARSAIGGTRTPTVLPTGT